MCGIAGGYAKDGIKQAKMQQATDELTHRGPDAGGYYTSDDGKTFLGHRRLSIIDLSAVANQPMYSADGRYVIIYNGEIYNFNNLRNKLPAHSWHTHSDTEVILELFAAFGPDSFSWLNGMFALAVYDTQEQKLYIARDQVGIKPIYYYWDDDTLIFGSELKVIKDYWDDAKLKVNNQAIPYFLHLGFIPEPLTIYRNVYKFPSGHFAVLDTRSGRLQFHKYWDAANYFLTAPIHDENEGYKKYKETIYEVVESQLISDVPLGTFLSGGIDSSLVTAVASDITAHHVKTFSIGFNESKYDESAYAEAIAKHLKTDHHTFKVSANDVMELVPKLLDVYDEPFADSSAFPTMLVSELARTKVTVTLSGDGGDELFQGYGMYTWAQRLQKPLIRAFHSPIHQLLQLGNNRAKRAGKLFDYPSVSRLHTHIFSQEQYFFSEKELKHLLTAPSFDFSGINDLSIKSPNANAAELQALWDFKNYLKDDLLIKVDRASMQYSLECRVPLLDQRIVELALNLDYNLKVKEGYGTKYLMKKVLYDLVPRSYFERPKRGFAIPLKEWLQGPLRYLVDAYLNDNIVNQYNIVKPHVVKDLLKKFDNGGDHLYNRVWLLIVLHWWFKKNNV